jgi:L-ribulose-5-phosphate 4-epimerase
MLEELKNQVYEANMELLRQKLVVLTWGNVSGIDRDENLFVIKPSGVKYEDLTPEKMVVVDLENNLVEGDLRPSSDTKTHSLLYRNFPNIGGICHTHSTYATSWAQAQKAIPCFGTTHADYSPCEIPVTTVMSDAQIARDYEEETGEQILEVFRDSTYNYEYTPMVLVAAHGPFTWGNSPDQAVHHAIILEEIAKMASITIAINPTIDPIKETLINKHFLRKHGKNAYYGQK